MAIFQFNMQIIGRSKGFSAVSAAAYRSGQKLRNDYTGTTDDYTKKQYILHSEVMLPDNAPSSYKDREVLWNAVERTEKGKNARLAREIEVALPLGLTLEENICLIRSYVQETFLKDGMIADVNIHCPPVRDTNGVPLDKDGFPALTEQDMIFRNPHAHILLTVRPMDEKGKWMPKSQKEYLCKKGAETAAFTAEEFLLAKKDGWEKQYQYYKGKQMVWMTPSEAFVENLVRVSKNPRSTIYGRRDEKMEYWNSPDALIAYRKSWEVHVNHALEKAGRPERVSALSYETRGMDAIAGIHLGSHLKTGSDRYRLNEEIKALEHANQNIRQKIGALEQQIQEKSASLSTALAERMAELEAAIISVKCSIEALEAGQQAIKQDIGQLKQSLAHIQNLHETLLVQNKEDHREIRRLSAQLDAAVPDMERERLLEKLAARKENIYIRKSHFQKCLSEEEFKNFSDYHERLEQLKQMEKTYEGTAQTIAALKEDIERYTGTYEGLCKYLPTDKTGFESFRKKNEEMLHGKTNRLSLRLPELSLSKERFRYIIRDTRYHLNHTMALAVKTKHLLSELDADERRRQWL